MSDSKKSEQERAADEAALRQRPTVKTTCRGAGAWDPIGRLVRAECILCGSADHRASSCPAAGS